MVMSILYICTAICASCWLGSLITMRYWMPKCCDPRRMYAQAFVIVLASPFVALCVLWEMLCIALTYGDESCREMREVANQPDVVPPPEELGHEIDIGEPPF
jgi:hypothetical protein